MQIGNKGEFAIQVKLVRRPVWELPEAMYYVFLSGETIIPWASLDISGGSYTLALPDYILYNFYVHCLHH